MVNKVESHGEGCCRAWFPFINLPRLARRMAGVAAAVIRWQGLHEEHERAAGRWQHARCSDTDRQAARPPLPSTLLCRPTHPPRALPPPPVMPAGSQSGKTSQNIVITDAGQLVSRLLCIIICVVAAAAVAPLGRWRRRHA